MQFFSLWLSKRTYIKPLPLFPWLYIYTNQWQIFHCLLIYSCIEREEEGKKKKRHYKNNILVFGYSVLNCFKSNTQSERTACPRAPAGFWWGERVAGGLQDRAALHARKHWLTSQWTLHMACHDGKQRQYHVLAHTETPNCSGLRQLTTVTTSYKALYFKNLHVLAWDSANKLNLSLQYCSV